MAQTSSSKPAERYDQVDPYHAPAGRDLDAHIHCRILNHDPAQDYPPYSTDRDAADAVKKHLERSFGNRITVGNTSIKRARWFARYEIDQGNPTEVLAESYPLAICRLAMLRANRA